MLGSDLCDYSDAYIVVKGTTTVAKKIFTADDFEVPSNTAADATATNNANNNQFGEKKLVFKNNAPFINCISKINGIKIYNAEDLNVVMPKYNLLEYSQNYRKTTGSLWNYYRDEPNSGVVNGITYSIMGSKSTFQSQSLYLPRLTDCLFFRFQEIVTLIADTPIQIIMYQKLELRTLTF